MPQVQKIWEAFNEENLSLLEGRPVSDSEQGLILHHLRRRLSVSIITAQSRCLLTRLNHMAPAAKEAAKKRAFNKRRQQMEKMTDFTTLKPMLRAVAFTILVSFMHKHQKSKF